MRLTCQTYRKIYRASLKTSTVRTYVERIPDWRQARCFFASKGLTRTSNGGISGSSEATETPFGAWRLG